MNYQEWGDPEAPAVVLLHSFAADLRMWFACIPPLAEDYRVIAPDLRGHGLTASPEDIGAYAMAAYAEDLRAFLDALEVELCALAGCGFGGMAALQFTVNWPERVAGLVLTDTSAAFENEAYDEAYRAHERGQAAAEAAVLKLGPSGAARLRAADVVDGFLAAGVRARSGRMDPSGYPGAARARRERPDLLPVIGGRLTMPVLICTGDRDPVHGASLVMAEQLPAARVVIFRDTGHGIPVCAPKAFSDTVLRFFADIEEGAPIAGRRVV